MTPLRAHRDESAMTLIELLIVLSILSVVVGAIFSIVMSTYRTRDYQQEMQAVIDDGRLSLQRIRTELRSARRVEAGTDGDQLRFWVDRNQDATVAPDEMVCYVVERITAGIDQWQIVRWDRAVTAADCAAGATPAGATRQVVARTLIATGAATTPQPFVEFDPAVPATIDDPEVRTVRIAMDLMVVTPRGPDSVLVEAEIRLRNVA